MAAYSIGEHVNVLVNRTWRSGVVKNRLPGTGRYSVVLFPELPGGVDSPPLPANEKEMAQKQVYVCGHCGNWVDPDRLPTMLELKPVEPGGRVPNPRRGRRIAEGDITLDLSPRCNHGDGIPWSMNLKPWSEVPGVTALGGIRAI